MKRAVSAEAHFAEAGNWRDEQLKLRSILLATPLSEEIKWGAPCYTYNGKNVVGIGGFKSYFGLWFYQGALLSDDSKVLINAQEGKTRALRQWRMTSIKEIKPTVIKRYVKEAISLIESGQEIRAKRNAPLEVPAELQKALRRTKGATAAFRQLRPGLRREYAEYIASAKRDDTKRNRVEKILPMISAGIGLNDRYRR
ncbi:MAG: DUF1801 domain-containing protein [Woeseiaceae bacterium]